jgi:hypothetical protein
MPPQCIQVKSDITTSLITASPFGTRKIYLLLPLALSQLQPLQREVQMKTQMMRSRWHQLSQQMSSWSRNDMMPPFASNNSANAFWMLSGGRSRNDTEKATGSASDAPPAAALLPMIICL